jgi:hypothetical protein
VERKFRPVDTSTPQHQDQGRAATEPRCRHGTSGTDTTVRNLDWWIARLDGGLLASLECLPSKPYPITITHSPYENPHYHTITNRTLFPTLLNRRIYGTLYDDVNEPITELVRCNLPPSPIVVETTTVFQQDSPSRNATPASLRTIGSK